MPVAFTDAQKKRKIYLNYEGGSLRCSLGLLLAIFKEGSLPSACTAVLKEIPGYTYKRTAEIGGVEKDVTVAPYTRKYYPSTPANQASGGTKINLSADGKYWTGWVSGTITSFVDYLCSHLENLNGPVIFKTNVGANYGPYLPPEG